MKILFIGGSGLLGKYLLPELNKWDGDGTLFERIEIDTPSHSELDITKLITPKEYDLIIHAAAYTDVPKAETDREACFTTNVTGTMNLMRAYRNVPFVLISTEYAHNPVNFYSETKLLSELVVKEYAQQFFIIRTLFKPTPFPFEKAFADQWTYGDEVDIIAPLIAKEIERWYEKGESRLTYIGTGRKTILDIARKSRPDVRPCSIKDIKEVTLPSDYQ